MTRISLNFSPPAGCRMSAELLAGSMVIIKHLQSRIEHLETEICSKTNKLVDSKRLSFPNSHSNQAKVLPVSGEVDALSEVRGLRAGTLVLVEHLQNKIRTLENELCAIRSKEQSAHCQLHEPVTWSVKVFPNSDSNPAALYQSDKDTSVFADSQMDDNRKNNSGISHQINSMNRALVDSRMDEYQESPIDSHMDVALNNSVSCPIGQAILPERPAGIDCNHQNTNLNPKSQNRPNIVENTSAYPGEKMSVENPPVMSPAPSGGWSRRLCRHTGCKMKHFINQCCALDVQHTRKNTQHSGTQFTLHKPH